MPPPPPRSTLPARARAAGRRLHCGVARLHGRHSGQRTAVRAGWGCARGQWRAGRRGSWCWPWCSALRRGCSWSLGDRRRGVGRLAVPPGGGARRCATVAPQWTPSSRSGALVSYGWSAVALVAGSAGELYFEVGTALVAFLLIGRWLEARARPGPAPRCGPWSSWARRRPPCSARTAPRRWCRSRTLRVGDGSWSARARRSPPTASWSTGTSAVDASLLTGESRAGRGRRRATPSSGPRVNAGGRLVVRATRVGERDGAGPAGPAGPARPSRARHPCSGWPTGCRRCSCRSSLVAVGAHLRRLAGGRVVGGRPAFTAGGGGADRRLPVRAGPGHADRAARRHRSGRAAGHPDPRAAGARVHPPRRHRPAGQDRHRDHRRADAWSRSTPAPGVVERRAAPAGRRGRARRRSTRWRGPWSPPRRRRLPPVEDFRALPGLGARGVGRGAASSSSARPSLLRRARRIHSGLETGSRSPGTASGAAPSTVADAVKPTSAAAVRRLRALGLRPILLTGDSAAVARAVAAAIGIDEVAGRGPAGRQGRRGPAAAGRRATWWRWSATASTTRPRSPRPTSASRWAPGTDVAIEASDLTIVRARRRTDLRGAADAVALSRATLRTIKANLGWAFGYNAGDDPAGRGRAGHTGARRCRDGPVERVSWWPTACACSASARPDARS